jgi:hypothetical protein
VATLAKARGEMELAVRLDGASQAAAESVGTARARPARAVTDAEIDTARAVLGEPAATATWEAGRRMTLEQAIDEALAWLDEGDAETDDAANAARWQRSPWTVFGWGATSAGGSSLEVSTSSGRRSGVGVPVYGEGGAFQQR